jgi:hypothetical protein
MLIRVIRALLLTATLSSLVTSQVLAQTATDSGSTGVQGTVSAPPPQLAPIISIPANGSSYSSLPVTVGGICDGDLLVKLFKNGVFAGAAQCQNGSFSMSIDLFNGQNELVARQYDLLDQESPPSATVRVSYSDSAPNSTAAERVTLATNFAKRGSNPGEALVWPFSISGGSAPYAISIDWGDSETSLQTVIAPGNFSIEHIYKNPGAYTVIVKAVDSAGRTAYLQVVAIANGPLSQEGVNGASSSGATEKVVTQTRLLWQPAAILIPLIIVTFWLGKRYAIYRIRRKIEAGERPFSY